MGIAIQKLSTESHIMRYLEEQGFRHSLRGFRYASEMIEYCLDNPDAIESMGDLYNFVGKNRGVRSPRIERAIRYEINTSAGLKMTNKEFIAKAVNTLRNDLNY
jgi:hypothetical protein